MDESRRFMGPSLDYRARGIQSMVHFYCMDKGILLRVFYFIFDLVFYFAVSCDFSHKKQRWQRKWWQHFLL